MTPQPVSASNLYGLDLAEFTSARDALVRKLKAEGRSSEAEVVKKLRRPTQSAWALNRLARTRPGLVNDVLAAGARLRDTMRGRGSQTRPDRGAQPAEREAVDAAVAAACEILTSAGYRAGGDVRWRIGETLRAAAADREAGARPAAGQLETDMTSPGFYLALSGGSSSVSERRKVPQSRKGPDRHNADARAGKRNNGEREKLKKLRDEVARARAEAFRLDGETKRAEAQAQRSRRKAQAAHEALQKATRRLEDATGKGA